MTGFRYKFTPYFLAHFPDMPGPEVERLEDEHWGAVLTLKKRIEARYEEHLHDLVDRSLNDNDEDLHSEILENMEEFATSLLLDGRGRPEPIEELLSLAAESVRTMISINLACPDLAVRNWGIRVTPDKILRDFILEPMPYDFGVSSLPQDEDADLDMEVIE